MGLCTVKSIYLPTYLPTHPPHPYHFCKIWNSDQLPEQVYQPSGTQDECSTLLDNYSHVMIEIHHGGTLFLIIDEAILLNMGP